MPLAPVDTRGGHRRLTDEGIAFAMVSLAPVDKLEDWRTKRNWDHRWVSSYDTAYHHDLLREGTPYLTYTTTALGTEAILPVAQIMDRSVYGRQQDWEDSPEGWPEEPTYG